MRKATKHFDRWSIVHRHNRLWTRGKPMNYRWRRIEWASWKTGLNGEEHSTQHTQKKLVKVHTADHNDSHECRCNKNEVTHTYKHIHFGCIVVTHTHTDYSSRIRADSKWSDFIRSGSYSRCTFDFNNWANTGKQSVHNGFFGVLNGRHNLDIKPKENFICWHKYGVFNGSLWQVCNNKPFETIQRMLTTVKCLSRAWH